MLTFFFGIYILAQNTFPTTASAGIGTTSPGTGTTCGDHCYFNDADYINAGSDPATTTKVMMWILK